MKGYHNILLIGLGVILIIIGFALINYLGWFILIPVGIGLLAIFKGVSRKEETNKLSPVIESEKSAKKENEEEPKEFNEKDNEIEHEESEDEEDYRVLGLKLKPSLHTKILKKVEPSVDALKPMIFWPFFSKNQSKEGEQKSNKELKYCKECGVRIPRTAKFCPECGK